jgi:hypothetical protein
MTIWRLHIPYWITKATNIHTHTHTLIISNTYSFSIIMVAQTLHYIAYVVMPKPTV